MKINEKVKKWKENHFGMFIHYGLYSLPAGVWKGKKITNGYSEQILSHGPVDPNEYEALKNEFTAEKFNAAEIARLVKSTGMTYLVITAKHHDGFCLFRTETTNYNSYDGAAGRDLVAELSAACSKEGIGLGLYYSWIDWNCPDALPFSDHNSDIIPEAHQRMNKEQITELMTNYGPICEVWFDMGKPTLKQSCELAGLVRKLQPDAMINGRIWNSQEDFIVLADNEIPDFSMDLPWQTPASIYHDTWGYRSWQIRDDLSGKIKEQIRNLATITALGGNHLLNIGPMGDGSIVPFEKQVLRGIGEWIEKNSEALLSVEPGFWEDENWGYSTLKGNCLYLQLHNIPESGKVLLKDLKTTPCNAYSLVNADIECSIEEVDKGYTLILNRDACKGDLPIIKMVFEQRPELDKSFHITPDNELSLEGRKGWIYQGEEYHSYKPCVARQSWTLIPDADGTVQIEMKCLKGQTIDISITADHHQSGKLIPLKEKNCINTKLVNN